MRKVSYVGQRFGRLIALERFVEFNARANKNVTYYKCKCDCGNSTTVRYSNLKNGCTNSCGCIKREIITARKIPDDLIRLHEIGRYYRRNAKVRNIEWLLSSKELESLVQKPCYYCGISDGTCGYIGVDRVDNSQAYTKDNCVPCCKRCNQGKNDMTLEEFVSWTNRIYEWRNNV